MKIFTLILFNGILLHSLNAQEWSRSYSTYFGGSLAENVGAVCYDDDGNIYMGGNTASDDLPVTPGSAQEEYAGGERDAFIVKFDSENQLVWCTYFGGSEREEINDMVWGEDGIYFCGHSYSNDMSMPPGNHQTSYGGGLSDAFAGKISPEGNLVWATYFGGQGTDWFDKATFKNGKFYCVGYTWSLSGVTSSSAVQSTINGPSDGLITVFNSSGSLLYSSYFGGNDIDYIEDIAVDDSENIFLCGQTGSNEDLATEGSHQTVYSGNHDGYVAKLNAQYEVEWCTLFGGDEVDSGNAILLDEDNNIWVGGRTASEGIPVSPDALMSEYNGEFPAEDIFLLQLSPDGDLLWSSYFGGNSYEGVNDIRLLNDNIIVGGYTDSNNLPVTTGAYQPQHAQYGEGVLLVLNPDYTLEVSTYYGGTGSENINSIAPSGDLLLVGGSSGSNNIMATPDAYKPDITNGYPDAYYTIFNTNTLSIKEVEKENGLSMYPNPAGEVIHIQSRDNISGCEVYNITGTLVYDTKQNGGRLLRIPLSRLATGTYMIRVYTDKGIEQSRFVVR